MGSFKLAISKWFNVGEYSKGALEDSLNVSRGRLRVYTQRIENRPDA